MTLNDAFAQYRANPCDLTLGVLYPFVKSRVRNVIRWSLSKFGEPEEALVVTVTTEVLTRLSTFRGESAFSTWVERIARWQSAQEARRIRRAPFQLFEPGEGTFVKELQSSDSADGGVLVEQVFADLSAEEQTLLAGKMERYSDTQIATLLQLPVGTIWSRWTNLRKKIMKVLAVSSNQRIGSGNATEDLGR